MYGVFRVRDGGEGVDVWLVPVLGGRVEPVRFYDCRAEFADADQSGRVHRLDRVDPGAADGAVDPVDAVAAVYSEHR